MSEVRKDLFIGVGFLIAATILVSFALALQVQAREGEDDNPSSSITQGVKLRGDGTVDDTQPGLGAQVQEQAQNQVQNKVRDKSKDSGKVNASSHRSAVANFVQSLLQVAEREPGDIGQQVRNMAQQQNQSTEVMVQAMEKVQTRSKVRTILFGSDYKNLGALRSEMVKTRNRLEQLNRLMVDMENEADKTELQNQIQALLQEQAKIDNFIKAEETKMSLFGWVKKIFNN